MQELAHLWGTDLSIGPTGDLALVAGSSRTAQRVLRRLLTNPGDYIWQPGYGAGLAQFVGQPGGLSQIRAVIRSQIFLEPAVATDPQPTIDVQAQTDGTFYVEIRYGDADTGETQLLSFPVGS
jgi:phage baseplate assembly protein W